jgi:tRNA (guanine6-N2)-methyltransferase
MTTYEALVTEGLEQISITELKNRFGTATSRVYVSRNGVIRFDFEGDPKELADLKTYISVFEVLTFRIPRPNSLMSEQNFKVITDCIDSVITRYPGKTFQSMFLDAAGSDSDVMVKFKRMTAQRFTLDISREKGDLQIRMQRTADRHGWEVLVRISPRPLGTRSWRVCDMKGALNAPAAHALVLMAAPKSDDVFLNICSGSGTLLIERMAIMPAKRLIGCDIEDYARECAIKNIQAAQLKDTIEVYDWNAVSLGLENSSVDTIVSDLPFGYSVGSKEENISLYPLILKELSRVAKDECRCLLLSHDSVSMNTALRENPGWELKRKLRINLRGMYPSIFILKKRSVN